MICCCDVNARFLEDDGDGCFFVGIFIVSGGDTKKSKGKEVGRPGEGKGENSPLHGSRHGTTNYPLRVRDLGRGDRTC